MNLVLCFLPCSLSSGSTAEHLKPSALVCVCMYVFVCITNTQSVFNQHTKEEVTFALQARAMEPQGAFVLSEPELCYAGNAGAQQSAQAYNMPSPFFAMLCVYKIQPTICLCFAIQLCSASQQDICHCFALLLCAKCNQIDKESATIC